MLRSCRFALPILIAVTAVHGLAGCASSGALVPPSVTLVDVELVDATLFESTFDVGVRIANDNPDPLVIDGVVLDLELDGRQFGKGSSPDRFEVPRFGSTVQRLEIRLSHVAIATKIRGVMERKVVDYAITGKVWVVRPSGGTKQVPIAKQGRIDLSEHRPETAETTDGP